ncbi:hypothetical protein HK405_009734, partial [Cladochytrium tenue]
MRADVSSARARDLRRRPGPAVAASEDADACLPQPKRTISAIFDSLDLPQGFDDDAANWLVSTAPNAPAATAAADSLADAMVTSASITSPSPFLFGPSASVSLPQMQQQQLLAPFTPAIDSLADAMVASASITSPSSFLFTAPQSFQQLSMPL